MWSVNPPRFCRKETSIFKHVLSFSGFSSSLFCSSTLRRRSPSRFLFVSLLLFYSSTTLAVAVTLPGSSETASSSARPSASASGAPPQPAGQLESAAAALSNAADGAPPPPPLPSSLELELPLRTKAGSLFPPRKTRWPPVATDAGGPQWPSTTREREEEEEEERRLPPFPSAPSEHLAGITSRTTEGPTHTTTCGGLDSTAQRPPSATSSNDGAEQTGTRAGGEPEGPLPAGAAPPPPRAPAPGKRSAAEQTGLAFAVAEALAAELAPPELVEAAAAAVEATAALSAARASELGEDEDGSGESLAAPAGRKGAPFSRPLRRGSSQSSRFVATSVVVFVLVFLERDVRKGRE